MPVSNSVAVADVYGKSHERVRGIHGICCGCMERELALHSRPWRRQNLRSPQPCYQPAPPPADMLCEKGLGVTMKTTSKQKECFIFPV